MLDQDPAIVPTPAPDSSTAEQDQNKKKKKRDKVRSAWISFVGRIVAQVMGAVATISLGLMLVQKYHQPASAQAIAAPALPPAVHLPRDPVPGEASIAVLPLRSFSPERDLLFAAAMTDTIIATLARHGDLHVVSRTSSWQYEHQRTSAPEIARTLGVNFVLDGSVVKADGRIRINAHLIDARRDQHLWVESYDRPLRDALMVQSEVAGAIAHAVRRRIAAPSLVRRPDRTPR